MLHNGRKVWYLDQLAYQSIKAGVQCMIEGPGHVPLHEVESQVITIKKLTHSVPLYTLDTFLCIPTCARISVILNSSILNSYFLFYILYYI